jgi:hypothetical protein
MTRSDTPKDGDFASYLEGKTRRPTRPSDVVTTVGENPSDPAEPPRQTIQQVLVDGEEPTDEFLEEWNALENAPDLSDEELARQALEAGGDDGDLNTPE